MIVQGFVTRVYMENDAARNANAIMNYAII